MRLIPGHWEGDLIKGKLNQSRVGTLIECKTLFVALIQLDDGSAKTTAEGFARILNRFDAQMRLSEAYDRTYHQGGGMAQHGIITSKADVKVFFAHPHSPWERGINENINGLLRQYLPKGQDLSHFTQHQIAQSHGRSTSDQENPPAGSPQQNSSSHKEPSTSSSTGQLQSILLHLVLESKLRLCPRYHRDTH